MNLSRRSLLAAGTASLVGDASAAPSVVRAQAPQFTYKYANNLPETHPMNVRPLLAGTIIVAAVPWISIGFVK